MPQADEEHQRVQSQDQQSTHRHCGEHRVDRRPPVFLPVDVGQVQDQRVLVEHQRGSDAEDDGAQGVFGFVPVDRQGHQRHPGDHHQQHSDHHMVDVHLSDVNVAWLPPLWRHATVRAMADQAHEGASHEKGEDEGDQTAQQRQSTAADDVVFEPTEHPRKPTPTSRRRPSATPHGASTWADRRAWRPYVVTLPTCTGGIFTSLAEPGLPRGSDRRAATNDSSRPMTTNTMATASQPSRMSRRSARRSTPEKTP